MVNLDGEDELLMVNFDGEGALVASQTFEIFCVSLTLYGSPISRLECR